MKHPLYLSSIYACLVLMLFSCASPEPPVSDLTVLRGAVILDGNGNRLTGKNLFIQNGRILEVADSGKAIPSGAEVHDLDGKYIMPGMVDAHMHFAQTGFFDGRPDALDLRDSFPYAAVQANQKNNPDRYYETYLRSGITAIYDVGGPAWSIVFQDSAEENHLAPHVAAAGGLITPFPDIAIFNTEQDTMMYPLTSAEEGRRYVRANNRRGSTGIKIWGMMPQDSGFMRNILAVKEETENVGNSLIVHATTLRQAKLALELGARLLVHSVADSLVDEEFLQLLKQNNALYNPTLQVSRNYLVSMKAVLGDEPYALVDPNRTLDAETRTLLENASQYKVLVDSSMLRQVIEGRRDIMAMRDSIMHENLRRVYEAGGEIVVGTDAGNPGTFHGLSYYAELEEMQEAGIAAEDLIIMATRNGAKAMERLDDFGTVEAGKMADLVILDRDPSEDITNVRSLYQVMRGGVLIQVDKPFAGRN